jgi:phasin family protein
MFLTPEQLLAAQKANVQSLVAASQTAYSGFEKLFDLNLKVVKATLEESAGKTQEALELKDIQDAVAFATGLAQPSTEKALAYSRHVADIVSNTGAEFARMSEEQVSASQRKAAEVLDQLAKNAPAGSESLVAILKSSFAASSSAYDTWVKASKQVTDLMQANFAAATNATFNAAAAANDAVKNGAAVVATNGSRRKAA